MRQWLTAKRWRIILAGVLITVTPTVLLAGFVSSEIQQHFTKLIMAANLQTTKLVASRIEERLASDTAFARAYAARPYLVEGLQRGDKQELDKHLKDLIENAPAIDRAFIASPAGIQRAAYPEDPATLGKDFSHRDWYQGVAKDWQPYISEFYLRAARPQRYVFAIAVPIKAEDGTVCGILVLQPKADYLEELMPPGRADRHPHVYVVDGKGRAIYHSEMKTTEDLVDFSDLPGVQKSLQGEEGTGIVPCPIHKESDIIAYAPIRKVGWGVVIYNSRHAVLSPLRGILYGIFGFTALMLVLGGFMSSWGANLFSTTVRLNRELAEKEAVEKAYSEFLAMLNLPWSDLEELGEAVLQKLCEETHTEAGVLYLSQDDHPAVQAALGVPKPLQPDELVQACLAQGKTISLVGISPESHFTLHGEAGVLIPREILAFPLHFHGEVIGVLELVCLHGLTQLDREIVERFVPRLAVSIQILLSNLEKELIARELARANVEFQAANEELSARQQELIMLNQRLEKASLAKSDFLANMSHELRTPLNSIIGFSEVLQEQMAGVLNEKQQEYVKYIHGSGRHLLALINDILDLAKVEAGKMTLEASSLPLKDLLESSMAMLKEKALKHGISLALDLDPALAEELIEVDGRKFKQILFNLLGNAVKFTPDGGAVRVTARLMKDEGREGMEEKSSFVPASKASGRPSSVKITVTDTGIGIRQEDLGRLFLSFSQLESPYTKQYEGTGLGLALTKKLIELHGGRLWVESEVGKGSSFIFTIPARQSGEGHKVKKTSLR